MEERTTQEVHDLSADLLRPLREIAVLLGDAFSDRLAERVGGLLPDFEARDKQTSYALEAIRSRLDTFGGQAELLENVNRTQQMLGEQFYDRQIIQPMVRGLFPLVDLLHQAMRAALDDQGILSALLTQLDQFLALYGIERFGHEPGDEFAPAVMKPLQRTVTNDPTRDGLVAESLQPGFRTPERILRLETVSLHRFDINASSPNSLQEGADQ